MSYLAPKPDGSTSAETLTLTNLTDLVGGTGLFIRKTGISTFENATEVGLGTVVSVSVISANGLAGTVSTPNTSAQITLSTTVTGLLKGNGTAISSASDGTDYLSPTTGITVSQTTPQTLGTTGDRLTKLWTNDLTVTNTIAGSITGNAGTVTDATFTTALTVDTGTLTLTANVANNSVLTIGAGAVSVSGSNTGDETQATIKTKLGAASTGVDGYLLGTDWDTFNGKLSANGDGSSLTGIQASQISIATGVGSPTVDQIQEYLDNTGSSGFFTGGELSDGGSGTLNVAAGSGFIRDTNNDNAPLKSFKWSASSGIAVADNTTQYVYVDDAGAISLSTDEFLEAPDKIQIGVVTDEAGAIVSTFSLGVRLEESIGQAGRFIRRVHGITRDNRKGGLIFGQSGDANRDVSITAGTLWWGRTEYPVASFNTSGADTFQTYSANGQENATASQFPNAQFDSSGTLTTMDNNKWANLFFFIIPDNGVIMVYGRAQFNSQALAEGEGVPSSSLPSKISETSILATRFTFKKSENTAVISSAFDTLFANAGVTDHGNLAGLADDDHTQYLLAAGTRGLSASWNAGAFDITANTFIGALTGNASTVTTNANLTGIVTSSGNATAIANKAIAIAKLADGTDGELITWGTTGVIETVAVGTAAQVLTSNGVGAAPTFEDATGGGVDTLAAIGAVPNANAATIAGTTLNLQPADASFGGVVTTGTQTFSGEKTFDADLQVSSGKVILGGGSAETNVGFRASSGNFTVTDGRLIIGGSSVTRTTIIEASSGGALLPDEAFASHIIGTGGTRTEGSSGTHPLICQLAIKPMVINNGSAATTNSATFYIEGASTGTASPSNNYALWVDDGAVQIDDTLTVGGALTATLTGDCSGNAGTVSTIAGLAPDTATTQATQAAITSAANLVTVGALASGSIASGFGTINIGTSNALSCGTIELGHATENTLSAASGVLSIEGVVIPSISSTNTLTNKRVSSRITTIASNATPTINTDNTDAVTITALAVAITSMTTNLSGTPDNFDKLTIRIKDNATPRTIAWGASFEDAGQPLPTTTVTSKLLSVGFIYNSVTSKWGCVAVANET